jgi:hypothetical protein
MCFLFVDLIIQNYFLSLILAISIIYSSFFLSLISLNIDSIVDRKFVIHIKIFTYTCSQYYEYIGKVKTSTIFYFQYNTKF